MNVSWSPVSREPSEGVREAASIPENMTLPRPTNGGPALPKGRYYPKLPALVFLLGFVAVLSGFLALQYIQAKMIETAGHSLSLAAADIADKLDRVLFERYADSKVMAKATEMYLRNPSALVTYLDTVQQSYPVYLWIAATDRTGTIIASTDPASTGQDRSQQDWFLAVRDGNPLHVRDVAVSADGGNVPAVAFTAPIITLEERFLGVVTSRIGLPVLEDAVVRTIRAFRAREEFFGHLEYQLLTESGDVFVDSLKEQAGPINLKQLGLPSAQLFPSGKPGYITERHLRRQVPVLTGYAQTEGYGRFGGLNWGVLVRLDLRDVLAPIRRVQWILGAVAAAVLFPLMGFLLWSSVRLRREWSDAQSQRARAEEAEQKLRDIVEHSTNLFYAHAGDLVMTYLSPQAKAYVGCDPADVPVAWTEFLTDNPVNRKGLALTRQAIETGRPQSPYEMELKAKDGRTLWVAVHEAPVVRDGKTIAVVGSLTDITERKRAEAIRDQLLDKVIVAQEEERQRIARELHDETEQALASLLIGLRGMEEAPTIEDARRHVGDLRRVAAQSLDELQRLVLGLRPSLLDELGLAAALQRLCTEFAHTQGIRVELHVGSLSDHRLPSSMETALYRIVQEALTNMVKHAAATAASVLFQLTASSVRMVVEDNGRGFDPESVRQAAGRRGGLGLYGMQERTAILGGTFTIESAVGRGTTIYVEIPLPSGALP